MKHAPWATKARWSGAWPGVATTVSGPNVSPSSRRTSAAWRFAPTGGSVPAAAFRSAMPSAWSAWSWVSAMPPMPPRSRASARMRVAVRGERRARVDDPAGVAADEPRVRPAQRVRRRVVGRDLLDVVRRERVHGGRRPYPVASSALAPTGCRRVRRRGDGTPTSTAAAPSTRRDAPRARTPPPPRRPAGTRAPAACPPGPRARQLVLVEEQHPDGAARNRHGGDAGSRSGRRREPVDRPAQRHDVHAPRPVLAERRDRGHDRRRSSLRSGTARPARRRAVRRRPSQASA